MMSRGSLTKCAPKSTPHDYRYLPEPDLMPFQPTESLAGGNFQTRGGIAFATQNRGSSVIIIYPHPMRKPLCGIWPWEIISRKIAKGAKNPKAIANWGDQ